MGNVTADDAIIGQTIPWHCKYRLSASFTNAGHNLTELQEQSEIKTVKRIWEPAGKFCTMTASDGTWMEETHPTMSTVV
jgi:hypothetical protein